MSVDEIIDTIFSTLFLSFNLSILLPGKKREREEAGKKERVRMAIKQRDGKPLKIERPFG